MQPIEDFRYRKRGRHLLSLTRDYDKLLHLAYTCSWFLFGRGMKFGVRLGAGIISNTFLLCAAQTMKELNQIRELVLEISTTNSFSASVPCSAVISKTQICIITGFLRIVTFLEETPTKTLRLLDTINFGLMLNKT